MKFERLTRTRFVPGLTDGFHTYGILVDEDHVTWYFDGIEMRKQKTPENRALWWRRADPRAVAIWGNNFGHYAGPMA